MPETAASGPETGLVLSCEHGGNRVPEELRHLFAGQGKLLESHRGYDLGALEAAREMASAFGSPLVASSVTRLAVDLNRSEGNPALFSRFTRGLPAEAREALLRAYYRPHRAVVADAVAEAIARTGRAVHVGVHSFTPVLKGRTRRTGAGLLHDPDRPAETALCLAWQASLRRRLPGLATHRNLPYRGTSDGLTTALRKRYPPDAYLGIELELNQRFLERPGEWSRLTRAVIDSLAEALSRD